MKYYARLILTPVMLVLLGLTLFACSQSADTADESSAERLVATPLPTLNFKQPTSMIEKSTPEGDQSQATPAANLSQGERIYNNKKCGDCHGDQGQGVEDKGKGVAGMSLSEAEFTDIMRTGGKGKLGSDHLYGPQAISPSGMTALYAYIKSLPKP